MTRRTRLFLFITAGILIVGVGTGLVASYAGFQGFSLTPDNGIAELAYLPQDSTVVAFANVREVMNSDLRRRFDEMRAARGIDIDSDRNEFEARTGIHFETDVEHIVASFAGGQDNERPLVVARGNFDATRIEALILGQGGQVEEYRNQRLLVVTEGDEPFAVVFAEPGVAVAGTAQAVRRAIDTKANQAASVTENNELMTLVREMDQGNAWAVGRFSELASSRLPDAVASQLPPITWFAATGRITDGVEGLVRAEANTEQGAADLRQVLQGFMALARLQTGSNAEFAALLNSLQLSGEGRTVSLSFSVPAELIDALGKLNQRADRAAPSPQTPDAGRAPTF